MLIVLYVILLILITVLFILLMRAYKTINTLKQTNKDNLSKIEYYKAQLIIRHNNTTDHNFELGERNER